VPVTYYSVSIAKKTTKLAPQFTSSRRHTGVTIGLQPQVPGAGFFFDPFDLAQRERMTGLSNALGLLHPRPVHSRMTLGDAYEDEEDKTGPYRTILRCSG
jgi:hypothetical protein